MASNIKSFSNRYSHIAFLTISIFFVFGINACSDKSLSVDEEQATLDNQETGSSFEGGGVNTAKTR